jgi:hypothetical protein
MIRVAPVVVSRDFPRLDAVRLDGPAIAFTAAAALVTTVLSGLAPALRGARFNLAESLHGGDGASAGGFRGLRARRLREGLLVAESAFAVLLLVAAACWAQLRQATHVGAGYASDSVLVAEIRARRRRGRPRPGDGRWEDALVDRARVSPPRRGAASACRSTAGRQIAGFRRRGRRRAHRRRRSGRSSTGSQATPGAAAAAARRTPLHDADYAAGCGPGWSTRDSRLYRRRIRSATARTTRGTRVRFRPRSSASWRTF